MKILYGVQGTGNGHISRSREIIKALRKYGHEVHTLFSGRKKEALKDVEDFEPFEVRSGLTFSIRQGRVQYVRTALKLNFVEFYKDIHHFLMPEKPYDLVLTDFEPLTARIAKKFKIPSIGIGHQYAFSYKIPTPGGDYFPRLILKYYAPVSYSIGLHWHHFDYPILPPIVPRMQKPEKIRKNKILVYLPFEDSEDIRILLSRFTPYDFHIYASRDTPSDSGHLHFHPFSRENFMKDLFDCGGVICNAGFELPSEALHLGKKILVKPLQGQFEQLTNAFTLSCLELGTEMKTFDENILGKWLASASSFPKNYPDVAGMIAEWVTRRDWADVRALSEKAWKF